MPTYDHPEIARLRATGLPWAEIGAAYDADPDNLRKAHAKWRKRQGPDGVDIRRQATGDSPAAGTAPQSGTSAAPAVPSRSIRVELPEFDILKVRNLDDMARALEVDMEDWKVSNFTGNFWQGPEAGGGVRTYGQLKANFTPNRERYLQALQEATAQLIVDAAAHAPPYGPIVRRTSLGAGDPCVQVLSIKDPHFGLLAWGKEVYEDQDLTTIARDYAAAVEHLLSFGALYPTEEIWYTVGDDTSHVNQVSIDGRGGTTARGTPQDMDGRLAKIFTTIRRSVVAGIDRARLVARVKVLVIPGNHDPDESYKLGEVLNAWYRNDPEVEVIYGPKKRKFRGYGKNAFMFTHGEEYNRTQRSQLPLIMATECPAEIWGASEGGYREIVTGHNHALKAGRYHPTSEAEEDRAIRTISLPGLTAGDFWHYGEGYLHRRAATVRFYHRSGGVAGHHEFTL